MTGTTSSVTIVGLVRDFYSTWPDANYYLQSTIDSGIAQSTLGSNGKPVYNSASTHPTISSASSYGTWYQNVSGTNLGVTYSMTLSTSTSAPNTYTVTNAPFWPLGAPTSSSSGLSAGLGHDVKHGSGSSARYYNIYWTYELHAVFTYLVQYESSRIIIKVIWVMNL